MFCFLASSATAKKHLLRRHRNNFDELRATALQITNRGPRLIHIGDRILLRGLVPATHQEWPTGNDIRSHQCAGFDFALPGEQAIQIAAHVAHPGNPVGEQ